MTDGHDLKERVRRGGSGCLGAPVLRGCVWISLVLAAVGAGSGVRADELQRYEKTEPHMGTQVKIVLYAAGPQQAERGFEAAFRRFVELNRVLSDYDIQSELSRLSLSSPHRQGQEVSEDLWRVLKHAQHWSECTNGAFDVTVGPLTRLWRRARRRKEMPAAERLDEARKAVGYSAIELDPTLRRVRLTRPSMRLDLGGIAKGYAADEALEALGECGIRRALIDAGGDLVLGDPPPGEKAWQIGVARLDPNEPPSVFLGLANCAIASSGDAWQYVEIDGQRYSHIVDPRTGLGLTRRSSVTVIAPSGTTADALASALSVLGPCRGLQLAEKQPRVDAWFIELKEGQPETRQTSGFLERRIPRPETVD